jgi:hypothetical protein
MRIYIPAFAAAALMATAAPAQDNAQGGLVNVNIQDVTILENFLNETQIAALNNLNVPITVQVPVGIAANVCNVNANVLAQQTRRGGDATCDAESGSQALAQSVSRQLLSQER